MGMDLSNLFCESFRFQARDFGWVYKLAITNGWEPPGTLPPYDWNDEREWSGTYFSNDGQIVSDVDARALTASRSTDSGRRADRDARSRAR